MATIYFETSDLYTSGGIHRLNINQGVTYCTLSNPTFTVAYPSFTFNLQSNMRGNNDNLIVVSSFALKHLEGHTLYVKDIEGVTHTYNKDIDMRNQYTTGTCAWNKSITLNTSNYFNNTNATSLQKDIPLVQFDTTYYTTHYSGAHLWGSLPGFYEKYSSASYTPETVGPLQAASSNYTVAYASLTLNAPPIFTSSQVSFNPTVPYNKSTTASVTLSGLTSAAQYGGYVTEVGFQIGEQIITNTYTANSQPSNEVTLSLNLNTAGSFTPRVWVKDSREQTTTKNLQQVTINEYTPPTIKASVERVDDLTWQPADEGTNVVITSTFTFLDTIATLQAPNVQIINQNNQSTIASVTWYSDRALNNLVNWNNITSGDTIFGKVTNTLDINYSYQIVITPIDSGGSGASTTQILAPAFYTIDFLAEGHGIAFGMPSNNEGFYCGMDIFLPLDDIGDPTSIEAKLYQAAQAGADILVPSTTTIDLKKLLYHSLVWN